MGIGEWFSSFCAELQVRNVDDISRRYRAITRRLNTDYWDTTSDAAHSLYVGSYGRNTAVKGFSDLDMIFELPASVYTQYDEYAGNGQSSLLQAVRSSIKQTYAVTDVGADGQVVLVPFDDGITFEVVPVFFNREGSYTFPDSNGGGAWRTTNPRPEIEAVRERNGACNGNLVPLCRILRAWKSKWDVPIGGLLVDTLAYQFIDGWMYKNKSYLYYDFLTRDAFKYLADQDEKKEYWKAPGSGQFVYGKGLFQYKAKRCYNLSLEAIQLDTDKKEWSAKQKWREIFGTAFPD